MGAKEALGEILEVWMSAFPMLRCAIEGHKAKNFNTRGYSFERFSLRDDDGDEVQTVQFCERCKLVFWE